MKVIKKIKFRAPSKVSLKGDDFLSKIKPVLGQNQINPVSFVNDYTKKTENLSEGIELLAQIQRMQDKSSLVILKKYSPALLAEQLSPDKVVSVRVLQDIIRIKANFDKSSNSELFSIAKLVLTGLKGYNFKR